jgi:hypothetical protein
VNAPRVTDISRALLFQRTGFVQIFRLNTMLVAYTIFSPTHAVSFWKS